MTDLPTSVEVEIIETLEDMKLILTLDGRRIGCKLATTTLAETQHLLENWWLKEQNRQWIWGDVILQAEERWGDEKTSQIIPDNDIAAQTLANWSSVARQYPHPERLYNVRWSIYAELAYVWDRPLREKLLLWAEETQATVNEVRAMKKKATQTTQDAQGDDLQPVEVQTAIEISNEQIGQIMLGNVRGLFSIVKQWRTIIQPGKKYRIVLEEVK